MKKDNVLKIIDEVMNNREIDSIRNAILAIRDKVLEMPDDNDEWEKDYVADLKLRGDCPLNVTIPYFNGANRVRIDTCAKLDTRIYGEIQYYKE